MDITIIEKLHEYLLTERSGTSKELGLKLGVSQRSLYDYISYMKKEMNAPINYDNQKGNYFYKRICELSFTG